MINRMEVIKLMAHLVITLVIIGAYVALILTGHKEEAGTFQPILILAVGYWFGAVTMNLQKQGATNDIKQ